MPSEVMVTVVKSRNGLSPSMFGAFIVLLRFVMVFELIALHTPSLTAMACTRVVSVMVNGPVYLGEASVGIFQSVV